MPLWINPDVEKEHCLPLRSFRIMIGSAGPVSGLYACCNIAILCDTELISGLFSDSGLHRAVALTNGEIVLYSGEKTIWDSPISSWRQTYQITTGAEAGSRLEGNFVMRLQVMIPAAGRFIKLSCTIQKYIWH